MDAKAKDAMEAYEAARLRLKLRPNRGRILILEDRFVYHGRIAIPEVAQRRPTTGTIVAIGDDVPEGFAIGQRVVYGNFAGTGLRFKGQPLYRVLTPDEVLCFIEEGEAELIEDTA
jgi:co-chaperonin GroES (HSP10)